MKSLFLSFQNLFSSRKMMLIFLLVVVLAGVLRIAFLSASDVVDDEPFYALRGIGWVDVLYGSSQTTPYHWFEELPWWSKLSFHDHPPLVFAIFRFFSIFLGDSLFAIRLVPAFFGVLSVILMFFISRLWFKDEKKALITMFLIAINSGVVFFSRLAMMESISLFFILLTFFFFLLALDNRKFLPWLGLVFGLSVIAKYVAFIPLPIYLLILFIYKREYFKDFYLYLAVFLSFVIMSPVIVYNFFLFKTVGHFDLQIAFTLGQKVTEWGEPWGKELRGDFSERLKGLTRLAEYLSPVFFSICLASFFLFLTELKKKRINQKQALLLGIILIWLLSTLLTGSSFRFLYYVVPFLILMVAEFIFSLKNVIKAVFFKKLLFAFFIIFELIYCLNGNILIHFNKTIGWDKVNFSYRVFNSKDFGLEKINQYFIQEFSGYSPGIDPVFSNQNIRKKVKQISSKNLLINAPPYKAMILTDNRSDASILSWVFARLSFYYGWPFINVSYLEEKFDLFELNEDFDDAIFYYVLSTPHTLRSPQLYAKADEFAIFLESEGVKPAGIYNKDNLLVFLIYKIKLQDMQPFLDN